ncbi:GPI-anchored cell surface glycoprotein [Aspergillus sclerotialis]|uniref:GPI-anchored cell surface glycoprotein n=1 Tax=Aspergillus sclerotialis TaxID=2070753 RepID=A0A3A2ZE74_9EURO|nr:GPI-anchored cell surface glycoprotein [Aspergillus sclerotialis]
MSLNGLDNPAITEAYQNALTDAGGWLLLRYVSRDEVTLFERGTGGVPEVRNSVDGYEEKSPLYGFLQYRRRKVVISYMPEGLSRLVQARTTVQFQSILDKFSPHDTVFTFSQSSELSESALSSACLLPATSGSITSSSSSLRRRRLMEITEDAEENTAGNNDAQVQSSSSDIPQKRLSQMSDVTVVPPDTAPEPHQAPDDDGAASERHDPNEAPTYDEPPPISRVQSARPATRGDGIEDLPRPSYEPRTSTQSTRPHVGHRHRKVKLGPRPSVDSSGRPRTSGSLSREADQRPVAALPAGIRSSSLRKPAPDVSRPRSQGSSLTPMSGRRTPTVPPLLVPPPSIPLSRPPPSPGAKSMGAMSTISASGTSQEKERLMKALQQRKKQMEKRAEEKRNRKATEEKLSPIPDVTENKENIERSQKKPKSDNEPNPVSRKSEKGKEPLFEIPPSAVPETIEPKEDAKQAPSDMSKPDSTVDMTSDSEGDQSSNTSPPSTAATFSTDRKDPLETTQTPQMQLESQPVVTHEPKTGASENETSDGPSSASADVPLGSKSQATPETEIILPQQTPTVPSSEQPGEHISTETPESIPLPDSQPSTSRPTSVAESSTVIITTDGDQQHDLPTPDTTDPLTEESTEQKEKSKRHLEPIQVPTPEYSDDDNISDDSFMEELKTATVEEAKPVSVGKSPLSPGFANSESDRLSLDWKNPRAVSNPAAVGHQSNLQAVSAGRSVSSPFYSEFGGSSVMMAKKINVSSGISKRIKALEKFSSRDPPPSFNQNGTSAPASNSFEDLRRRASASKGSGAMESIVASRRTSYISEEPTRAPSVQRSVSQLSTDTTRRQSFVSVTAHIVRDPAGPDGDSTAEPAETGELNLQPSPLTVEHEPPELPLSQTTTTDSAANKSDKRSMSVSSAGSGRPSLARLGRSDSKMSISSRSKASDVASSPDEKKESRTSRMLRLKEEEVDPISEHVQKEPEPNGKALQPIDIGEVNIQFPDTLLWKRRFMRIDDKGYLVFAPGNIDSSNRNMIKRYHLTEFIEPCLPDEDRQELPNSILLDFLSGSTLQAACESRQGQESLLQTLLDAYNTHQQLSSQ